MSGDRELVQIVDAALAEAARKSGDWLACRPGCFECCLGPFPITALDAERLRTGFTVLAADDPARAARVRQRVHAATARLSPLSPADARDEAAFGAWLAELPDDDPCPALDPATGTCDLYAARPLTCRFFGPPIRWGPDAVGVCELCFVGATDEEIAACEVTTHAGELEAELLRERGEWQLQTVVALALSECR